MATIQSLCTLNLDKAILDIKVTMAGHELNDIIIYWTGIKSWSQAVQEYYKYSETSKKTITGGHQLLITHDNELFVLINVYNKIMIQPGDQKERKLLEFLETDYRSFYELCNTVSTNSVDTYTAKHEYKNLVVMLPPITSVSSSTDSTISVSSPSGPTSHPEGTWILEEAEESESYISYQANRSARDNQKCHPP